MRAPALHRHRFLFECYSFEAVVGMGLEASASQNRIERVLARRWRPRKKELFARRSMSGWDSAGAVGRQPPTKYFYFGGAHDRGLINVGKGP